MHKPRTASQQGFSLVELMVALLIGVILTSGVISVYITSKASYSMNNGLGQVQEAGRFALGIMQPILVMAGNAGCSHPLSPDAFYDGNEIINPDPVYIFRYAVYGFEYTGTGIGAPHAATAATPIAANANEWSPALSISPLVQAQLIGSGTPALKYSDVLMVHEMLTNPATVTADTGQFGAFTFAATNAPPMSAGMLMMASNCVKDVDVFQATGVTSTTVSHANSGSPGNSTPAGAWGNLDLTKGSVGPAQAYVFFVGSGIGGESSLFEASLNTAGQLGTPKEMVPGVENMQVLYGVDTDTDSIPNNYETAAEVDAGSCGASNCWNRVVSVRVALLVHSDANTTDQAPSSVTKFHMLGTVAADSFTYTPYADRRLRRYFVQTFSLRNLLP
jgi:type IV pilus assembly protein PilW